MLVSGSGMPAQWVGAPAVFQYTLWLLREVPAKIIWNRMGLYAVSPLQPWASCTVLYLENPGNCYVGIDLTAQN